MANIFGTATPDTTTESDFFNVSLGVKFRASVDGQVDSIRLYVGDGDPSVGAIYNTSGTQLVSVALSGLTGAGWTSVNFASPLSITAETIYVAVVYWPGGEYPVTNFGLESAVINGDLEALDDDESNNGVYNYGTGITYPTSTYQASNYFTDIEFTVAAAGASYPIRRNPLRSLIVR